MTIETFEAQYEFLSNFSPALVKLEGAQTYPTVEHAYQAAKTFSNMERRTIRLAHTPAQAKRLGQKAQLRDDWEFVKLEIMEDLLRQKFKANTENAAKLIATGDQELIEGNWWNDTFWGVCKGRGENHLGKLLMLIRSDLRRGQS